MPAAPNTFSTNIESATRTAPTGGCSAAVSRCAAPGRRPTRIAGSLTEVDERAAAPERLRSAGFRDPLTGLCNRAVFVEALRAAAQRVQAAAAAAASRRSIWISIASRSSTTASATSWATNCSSAVSRRLESCLRPGDALARLGGDEFAILLDGLGDETQANAIAFRIQDALSTPFTIGGREVFTSASIGIAFSRPEYVSAGRDHARRRHGDVSREGARQGAARAVRRRHARARARSARPRERSAPRRQEQRLRGALPANRVAGDAHVHRLRVARPLEAQRRSGVARRSSFRWPRSWG